MTSDHEQKSQRWVLQGLSLGGNIFNVYSSVDECYVTQSLEFGGERRKAANLTVSYEANGGGNALQMESGRFISADTAGQLQLSAQRYGFDVFSVIYA